ncbi:MAG: hypothetical protein FJX61_00775 [Alphaproteobacteria bacterium]|nr:hypothetical protein [Alphaproteobacteria bacterium]
MTSAVVLLGAEFDKIVSILLVTAILAIAITRARRTPIQSVRESAAARDLSRFFRARSRGPYHPGRAADPRRRGRYPRPRDFELRHPGITALAKRLPTSDVIKLLADYETRMVAAIQRHGSCIDKFMGDGIMATFGAVLRTETLPLTRCAQSMRWSSPPTNGRPNGGAPGPSRSPFTLRSRSAPWYSARSATRPGSNTR